MTRRRSETLQSILFLICVLGLWQAATVAFNISPVIFPAPSKIAVRFYQLIATGQIWPHFFATLTSILSGFGIGIVAGVVVGAMVSLMPWFERLIYPYLVALQSVPKIAIAPLFVLWFGYGVMSKVVITGLVCFFPVLVSVIAGFNSTDRDQLEMMKSFGASRWQTLRRLRIPAALVLIFAGIEIAAVLAVIGAVVGEFVGAQQGLGYLITALNFSLDVPGVFAVLIFLSAIGICLHAVVRILGRRLVFWIHRDAAPLVG
ncbi:ABC transporter permease [Aquabacter sp. CN5-332]|uniref:ABC transporter permease n=1 Tax=Aquabacter sp. CN5-332 TaxID=3156608 RepID=UPI0032B4DC00